MQINSNLSTDNAALAAFQNQRTTAGAATPQNSSTAASDSTAGQLDSSLQRLTGVPIQTQDAHGEIQNEQDANQVMDSLRQSMMHQPGTVMSSQAGQFQLLNALGLLQSSED